MAAGDRGVAYVHICAQIIRFSLGVRYSTITRTYHFLLHERDQTTMHTLHDNLHTIPGPSPLGMTPSPLRATAISMSGLY